MRGSGLVGYCRVTEARGGNGLGEHGRVTQGKGEASQEGMESGGVKEGMVGLSEDRKGKGLCWQVRGEGSRECGRVNDGRRQGGEEVLRTWLGH